MNKIEYFNKEYSYIKDNKKREDLKLLVNELPDYFFDIPASSTGKYHPDFAKSEHGLVKHTKVAVRMAYELYQIKRERSRELIHFYPEIHRITVVISIMIPYSTG